jgi:hypothetical protein
MMETDTVSETKDANSTKTPRCVLSPQKLHINAALSEAERKKKLLSVISDFFL